MSGGGYLNNGYDTLSLKYNPYIQSDFMNGGIENVDKQFKTNEKVSNQDSRDFSLLGRVHPRHLRATLRRQKLSNQGI